MLQHLFVEQEFRRQGIAQKAIIEVFRKAKHIVAEVHMPHRTRPGIMYLLERIGYTLVGVCALPDGTMVVRYVHAK